jgi:hypothetical protein
MPFPLESEENVTMIFLIVGILIYAAIFLVCLSFCKISAQADRDMRMMLSRELLHSDSVGQNLFKLATKDKDSKLLPVF